MSLDLIFTAISWASFIVGATTFINETAPRERQMEALGLLEICGNTGHMLGPVIFAQPFVATKSFVIGYPKDLSSSESQ